jgi:hypothetical protein
MIKGMGEPEAGPGSTLKSLGELIEGGDWTINESG